MKTITNNHFTENLITEIYGIALKQEQFILLGKSGLLKEFNWKEIKTAINFFKFNEKEFEIKINIFDIFIKWISLIFYLLFIVFGYIALYFDLSISKLPLFNINILKDLILIITGFIVGLIFFTPRFIAIKMKKYLNLKKI